MIESIKHGYTWAMRRASAWMTLANQSKDMPRKRYCLRWACKNMNDAKKYHRQLLSLGE